MAYDESLAARVRGIIGDRPDVAEKRMFGGLASLLNGNMACGVSGQGGLMVRLPPEETDAALAEPGARVFDMSGRPMKGWIRVDAEGTTRARDLRRWVQRGLTYAGTLPPK